MYCTYGQQYLDLTLQSLSCAEENIYLQITYRLTAYQFKFKYYTKLIDKNAININNM